MNRKIAASIAVVFMVGAAVLVGGVLIPLIVGGVSYTVARGGRP